MWDYSQQKEYYIGKVSEYGLLEKRKYRCVTSSPDRVFLSSNLNENGNHDFIGLCALEIKTQGTRYTADQLAK